MQVTCTVVGGETHEVEVPTDATYGDVLAALDVTRQEAAVLVDGTPVPADRAVDTDAVRVLRLIHGG